MIEKIIVLLLSFFLILLTLRTQENFTLNPVNPISNNSNYGIHSVVDPEEYNLNYYGPKCLNTCLVEHVQKVNWDDALRSSSQYARENILQFNRDNTNVNFCHLANTPSSNDETIKDCRSSDCINTCGSDLYSHCEKTSNFCRESNLNYLSGGAILHKSKCSGGPNNCVNKYWQNIQTIKGIYDNNVINN